MYRVSETPAFVVNAKVTGWGDPHGEGQFTVTLPKKALLVEGIKKGDYIRIVGYKIISEANPEEPKTPADQDLKMSP